MVKGRIWLLIGVALGIGVAAGRVPYLAGAGRTLAVTAERLVLDGANHLVSSAARHGAPKRVVLGVGALLAAVLPGVTALLLIVAAKATLRIRAIIAVLMVALGALSYLYHSSGSATGVLLLAMVVAGIAVTVTGPLAAAPLALGAGLLGAEYLPTLLTEHLPATRAAVDAMHVAIYDRPGTPRVMEVAMLIAAALPFGIAARMVVLD